MLYQEDFPIIKITKYYCILINVLLIHQEYESLDSEIHYRSVSLITFQRQWHELICPGIVITKPCTDLCQHYQDFAEDKELLLSEYGKHVQLAKEQRNHYITQVESGKQNLMGLPDDLKEIQVIYFVAQLSMT